MSSFWFRPFEFEFLPLRARHLINAIVRLTYTEKIIITLLTYIFFRDLFMVAGCRQILSSSFGEVKANLKFHVQHRLSESTLLQQPALLDLNWERS